jgi:transcriptional regulator with XRE-family HTH domain
MSRNQRIKEALKGAGKTQTDLASLLGVTQSSISERLNTDKEIDSFDVLVAVASLTGKNLWWLAKPKSNMLSENPI